MKSFEERRQEYLEKLRKHTEYIVDLSKKDEEELESFLFPKNEEELNIANAKIMIWQDKNNLTTNVIFGNVEEIDLKNCVLIEFLATIFNSSLHDYKIEDIIKPYISDDKIIAEMLYQDTICESKSKENIQEIIKNKCDIQIDNILELAKFSINFVMAIAKVKEILDDIYANRTMSIAKYFHEFCVKGIKQNSDSQTEETLGNDTDFGKQKRI